MEQRHAVAIGLDTLQANPSLFAQDALGINLLPFQSTVAESVRDNRLTAVCTAPNVGKTLTAAVIVLWFFAMFRGARVITTAPTAHHVEKILWQEITKRYHGAKIPLGGRLLTTRLERPGEDWMAYGISTNTPSAFGGSHKEHQLVVFDDAHGIDPRIWEVTMDNLMSGTHCRFLAIGNPLPGAVLNFRKAFRPGSGFNTLYMSRLEHPNVVERREVISGAVTHLQVDAIKEKHGEGSVEWTINVEGKWAESADDVLIPLSWFEAAALAKPTTKEPKHIGVDVARQGSDINVLTVTENGTIIHQESWRSPDTFISGGHVLRNAKQFGVQGGNIHVDVGGPGGGVVDACASQGLIVDPVNFGEAPAGDWIDYLGDVRFKNRKAELHWVMRERIRRKDFSVDAKYSEVWQDLSTPSFKENEKREIIIEPKDSVKQKLGHSPDFGDSLVLAQARTGNNVGVRWL